MQSKNRSASFDLEVSVGLCISLGAVALAVLSFGPVTAGSATGKDAVGPPASVPIKDHLAPSGSVQEEWVARYDDPSNNADFAFAIAVDGSGNVYVTGESSQTSGSPKYDYVTIKYNSTGIQQWVARYNGPASDDDYAKAIAVDSLGNVYVTGWSTGLGTSYDFATIKYDSAGQEQWVARHNGLTNDSDIANALAVDGSGNVYVTGQSDFAYATIKYDSSGQEQWVASYGSAVSDSADALALDSLGNVYVTGGSYEPGFGGDYATIKYDSSGQQQWVASYDGPGNSDDIARAIAIDGSGNVYVTGQSFGSGTFEDYATIKYDSSGTQQWVARYNGSANGYDLARAIAVDASGNVCVTGQSWGGGSTFDTDYATIKYDNSGQEQWVARYGPDLSGDFATGITVDASGNVYVTGESFNQAPNFDYVTLKYDPVGTEEWLARYNGPGNSGDGARAIALDDLGNVYVTGGSYGSGFGGDYATIKYSQTTPTPTVTPTVTATATSTATPTSTATATPTPRPHPTAKPHPTPRPHPTRPSQPG